MMTLRHRVLSLKEKVSAWWHERPNREQRVLIVWSISLLVLVLWFGMVMPMRQRIDVLEQRVPALELVLGKMRSASSAEIGRATASRQGNGGDLLGQLKNLLAERGTTAEMTALSAARVEVRLPEMSAAEAFELLDSMRRGSQARVEIVKVKAGSAMASSVRIVAELERSQ